MLAHLDVETVFMRERHAQAPRAKVTDLSRH